jgi:hypothetical protein
MMITLKTIVNMSGMMMWMIPYGNKTVERLLMNNKMLSSRTRTMMIYDKKTMHTAFGSFSKSINKYRFGLNCLENSSTSPILECS